MTGSAGATALFERDGEAVRATELARGPWDPNALHGGATAALCAWVAERHDPGPAGFVAKLSLELLRPVPLARLHIEAMTIRPGRRVQWIDVQLRDDDGAPVAVARVLRVQRHDDEPFAVGEVGQPVSAPMPKPPAESGGPPIGLSERVGFWSAMEFRMAGGDWMAAGPGAAWMRLRVPVIDGEAISPLQRVAAAADFGSGVGNAVRETALGTINPELTIHVHRAAAGEWVGLDSRSWVHDDGVGMCETVLHDTSGPIGRAVQSLVVVPVVPWVREPPQ
jgi:hypothetical protein